MDEIEWLPNLAHTRLHVVKRGWTERGTGLPAACDKQGIFLRDDLPWEHKNLPKCRSCTWNHTPRVR